MTGEAKLVGVLDFMDTLIENNCKFIMFAHHQRVMDGIENFIKGKKEKIGYIRIDGSVNVDARHERVQAF